MQISTPIAVLERTADQLEVEARAIRRRIRDLQKEAVKRKELAEIFESIDAEEDPYQLARKHALPVATIRKWQRWKVKQAQQKERLERSSNVMRLYEKGYCKAEIGRILGISRRTVLRAINETITKHPIEALAGPESPLDGFDWRD